MNHVIEELTEAEQKVLGFLIDGHNRESISNQLEIKMITVSCHMHRIMRKLQVHEKSEIIVWYYQTYWCPK